MLLQAHIDRYRKSITHAGRDALNIVQTTEMIALGCKNPGCIYCSSLRRHKALITHTTLELLSIVDSLREGMPATKSFPKKMFPDLTMYRGFILDTGEYIDLLYGGGDHSEYKERYTAEHGEERAYKMITVNANDLRTLINFFDRKYPPSTEQLATLQALMIDAEGSLNFRFSYNTNHPA